MNAGGSEWEVTVAASLRTARVGGKSTRILGIDPGTVVAGWGVIDDFGSSSRHVASGIIRLSGARAQRLARLHAVVSTLIASHAPAILALEKNFVGENVQSAFRIGEARGVVIAAAATAGMDVSEYAPATIKSAVTGSGRATKVQVQRMIATLLAAGTDLSPDQADALAVALCHAHAGRLGAVLLTSPRTRGARSSSRREWEQLAAQRARK